MWYYRTRYYQAGIGRFGSEDPLRFEAEPSLHLYVGANPTSFTDPLGYASLGGGGREVPGSGTGRLNCMAWALGITDDWVSPGRGGIKPDYPPNKIPDYYFGCTSVGCDKECEYECHKVMILEDTRDPRKWHVMRNEYGASWSSKNGGLGRFVDIPDPDRFYDFWYKPNGPVVKTCFCCPNS